MAKLIREFQVFVKPVGDTCNLNCSYCYYTGKKDMYGDKSPCIMSYDVLENYIIQQIETSSEPVVTFSWHGGEPLMAGLEFFRDAVSLQNKYIPDGRIIVNGIQTNGTLLDHEWCNFLSSERFIVGISMDGPEELHDKFRISKDNSPSFQRVLTGYKLLRAYNVEPEILCVINADNVNYPKEIYRFFKSLGAKYISFLPLVEFRKGDDAGVSANSVPAGSFGVFLASVFDEWVDNDIGKIKIQIFEEAARTAFNQEHTLCIFKDTCGRVPVVEFNGDFYSCDHFVNPGYLRGNIMNHHLAELLESRDQKAFGLAKRNRLPGYCLECEVLSMCNGECPKNRFIKTPGGEGGLNYLCAGYKYFFNHCRPFVDAIAAAWLNKEV